MEAIRIKNLRNLADTGLVKIRPITVLLGLNSSGKSTFLRSFPLLRQSAESKTTGPLLWFGRYVDFGSFSDALRRNSQSEVIELEFEIDTAKLTMPRRIVQLPMFSEQKLIVGVAVAEDPQGEITKAVSCKLNFFNHEIEIGFDFYGKVNKYTVNGSSFLDLGNSYLMALSSTIVPSIYANPTKIKDPDYNSALSPDYSLFQYFYREFRKLFYKSTKARTVLSTIASIRIDYDEAMLLNIKRAPGGQYWKNKVSNIAIDSDVFRQMRNGIIAYWVPPLLTAIDMYIARCCADVNYIAPLRATAERYYRSQDLSVNEVDFRGTNLSMFLRSLNDVDRNNFQDWMSELFGISVMAKSVGGHISLEVHEPDGQKYNLADVGFGLSQLLPIVVQLWVALKQGKRQRNNIPITFAVEQPEVHLHPALQAKMADLFVSSVSNSEGGLRILVETHSEAIVNRIGDCISKGLIRSEDVQVVIFERKRSDLAHLANSIYDEEGVLIDWPYGFFQPEVD